MTRDRLTVLRTKAKKIQAELTAWARKSFSLSPRERFLVTIDVIKDPPVTVKPRLSADKGRRRYITNDTLTKKDWSGILSISWVGVHKSIIEIFREKINQPVSTSELEIANRGSSRIDAINAKLRAHSLPFAIRQQERGVIWPNAKLYMYRVEAERW